MYCFFGIKEVVVQLPYEGGSEFYSQLCRGCVHWQDDWERHLIYRSCVNSRGGGPGGPASHGSKQPQVRHLDWTSADKHALLWASRGRWVPAPTPTEIGGASGGASTAIVAVMNLETRHEAPHFEEQPCSCPEKVATTRREAEPTQG